MADIRFERVRKVYPGNVVALEEFSLEIPSPTLVVLVGPSGCGKTTLLRLLAGLERPTSGEIYLGIERLDTVDPRHRDVAMVFQSYALYPHMTVRENLSFGLKVRKTPRETIVKKVEEVSTSIEIGDLLDRRPAELSGGQRQRVALGRAIVREPKVFLFDEPLSNLDARLRDDMRYLIKRLYQRLRTTTVYVTHDQVEAMTIGEMLVVLRGGRVHQVGSPSECYSTPADAFVASFLGSPPMNLLEGRYSPGARAVSLANGTRVGLTEGLCGRLSRAGVTDLTLGVRPEDIALGPRTAGSSPLAIDGRVVATETLGHDVLAHVDLGGREVVVRKRARSPVAPGDEVSLSFPEVSVHFFAGGEGRRVSWADGDAGAAGAGVAGEPARAAHPSSANPETGGSTGG
jgi:ABC-type sugar transport system ATPase subunit